nr:Chain D, LEDGF peptide [Homo sapiens]3AVC_F Chain F, LEDGF peptide [Homo sapiens]
SDKIDNLD